MQTENQERKTGRQTEAQKERGARSRKVETQRSRETDKQRDSGVARLPAGGSFSGKSYRLD